MLNQKNTFINLLKFKISLILGGAILFNFYLFFSQVTNKEPSLINKKIIYIYGGCEFHSPKDSIDLFVPLLEKEGAMVQVNDNIKIPENSEV